MLAKTEIIIAMGDLLQILSESSGLAQFVDEEILSVVPFEITEENVGLLSREMTKITARVKDIATQDGIHARRNLVNMLKTVLHNYVTSTHDEETAKRLGSFAALKGVHALITAISVVIMANSLSKNYPDQAKHMVASALGQIDGTPVRESNDDEYRQIATNYATSRHSELHRYGETGMIGSVGQKKALMAEIDLEITYLRSYGQAYIEDGINPTKAVEELSMLHRYINGIEENASMGAVSGGSIASSPVGKKKKKAPRKDSIFVEDEDIVFPIKESAPMMITYTATSPKKVSDTAYEGADYLASLSMNDLAGLEESAIDYVRDVINRGQSVMFEGEEIEPALASLIWAAYMGLSESRKADFATLPLRAMRDFAERALIEGAIVLDIDILTD